MKSSLLRLVRLEQTVFDEAKRLRKQLAPALKFKTLSGFIAHVLDVYKSAPAAPQVSPERVALLELRQDIYSKLDKIEELLVAKAVVKTVTMNIDNLVGNMVLPEPKTSVEVEQALTQAITDALRGATHQH